MKLLLRNTTLFEYLAPLPDEMTDLNDDGDHTGEFEPVYDAPVTYRGNISTPSGQVEHQFYGEDIRYTHTLVMSDPKADIRETGLIRKNGIYYDIMAVRPSLNVLDVALKRQTTGAGDPHIKGENWPPVVTGETGETGETGGEGE